MKAIFVDTSYWIAILYEKDDLHKRALFLQKKIANRHLITSEMILTELLNEFSRYDKHFRNRAVSLVEELRTRNNITIVPQTSVQFTKALHIYEKFFDKKWSHTDCASYLIMKEKKITDALSHDHHFKQMGINATL